jgi:hypothetical protein
MRAEDGSQEIRQAPILLFVAANCVMPMGDMGRIYLAINAHDMNNSHDSYPRGRYWR